MEEIFFFKLKETILTLLKTLKSQDKIGVLFSGGVDSTIISFILQKLTSELG
jgi:PP-loop superfamily ATP-utilizing enzyme